MAEGQWGITKDRLAWHHAKLKSEIIFRVAPVWHKKVRVKGCGKNDASGKIGRFGTRIK